MREFFNDFFDVKWGYVFAVLIILALGMFALVFSVNSALFLAKTWFPI